MGTPLLQQIALMDNGVLHKIEETSDPKKPLAGRMLFTGNSSTDSKQSLAVSHLLFRAPFEGMVLISLDFSRFSPFNNRATG
jgi:hypothetical protein